MPPMYSTLPQKNQAKGSLRRLKTSERGEPLCGIGTAPSSSGTAMPSEIVRLWSSIAGNSAADLLEATESQTMQFEACIELTAGDQLRRCEGEVFESLRSSPVPQSRLHTLHDDGRTWHRYSNPLHCWSYKLHVQTQWMLWTASLRVHVSSALRGRVHRRRVQHRPPRPAKSRPTMAARPGVKVCEFGAHNMVLLCLRQPRCKAMPPSSSWCVL